MYIKRYNEWKLNEELSRPFKWVYFKYLTSYNRWKKPKGVYFFAKDPSKLKDLDKTKMRDIYNMGKGIYAAAFNDLGNGIFNFSFVYDLDQKMKSTNRNEQYNIMSTLVDIAKDFIGDNIQKIKTIHLNGLDARRAILYYRTVKQSIENDKYLKKIIDVIFNRDKSDIILKLKKDNK